MPDEMEGPAEQQMIDCKCPYCGEGVSFPAMDALTPQDCPFCMGPLIVPKQSGEEAKKFPLPIFTPRLYLQRLAVDDADALAQLSADQENLRFHYLRELDEEDIAQWLDRAGKTNLSELSPALYLTIQLRNTSKFLGLATIQYSQSPYRMPEFDLVILKGEQLKGFGTEAVRGILDFCFNGLNMRRVTTYCDSRNEPFMKLAAKVGLRQEGAFFEDRYVKGEWVNTAYYAMLQSEYQNAKE